jgi:sigma-B regulation protein RsbU (phosphoserine phosphatase)
LAVDEIATNIVTHGYAEAGLEGAVKVEAFIDEKHLTVYLEDTGAAYDPTQASMPDLDLPAEERPIGGLGVYLVIQGVDKFRYERVGDRNRNIFIMNRKGAPAEKGVKDERKHLLVAAHGKKNRDDLSSLLGELGYKTTTAEDGRRVVEILREASFDLVLLDVKMPKMNAHRILESLKTEGILPRFPVVVLSALDDVEMVEKCIEMGAEDYLTEPFNKALLKARIDSSVERRQLRNKLQSYSQQLVVTRKLSDDLTSVILPIGTALSAEKNFDTLLERILLEARSICNADAGTLYLRTEDNRLKFEIMRTNSLGIAMGGTTGKEIPLPPLRLYDEKTGDPNHHNVATHVALNGLSVNIPDIYHAEGFDFSGTKAFDKKNGYRSTSSLTIPMKNNNNEVIGVIQLLNAQDHTTGKVIPFNSYLQQVVESMASQAAIALNNQLLLQREKKLVKFENDVQIGRKIQIDFLPEKLPQPPGWELAACFHPAREVSGDFYDAFILPGNHLGFVIVDVCDKGVPAALFMAVIRSLIRAFSEHPPSHGLTALADPHHHADSSIERRLTTILADLNALSTVVLTSNYIANNHSRLNMFATLFFGVLDPSTGLLIYTNAGHEAPAIIGPSGVKARLRPTGPAVGIMPNVDFDIQEVQLEPGHILVAYTDGVPETRDPNGHFFTEKRFLSLLEEPAPSAAALLDRIETNLKAHIADADQFDDITMLAIRMKP